MTNKKFKLAAMSLALTACVAASPLAANAETGAEATSSTPAVETPAPAAEPSAENAPTTNETKQESTDESKKESTGESKQESTDEAKQNPADETKQNPADETKQNPADETKPEVAVENKVLAEAPAAKAPVLMLAKAPAAPTGASTAPAEENTAAEDVATINGKGYKSFDEAVKAAESGDTIEVIKDATSTGIDLQNKNLTIKGKTVTTTTDSGTEEKNTVKPKLTFKKGISLKNAELLLKNLDVDMTGISSTPNVTDGQSWMGICLAKDSTLTLDNTDLKMDGTGCEPVYVDGKEKDPQGIYMDAQSGSATLNVLNNSHLTIDHYDNAVATDGATSGNAGSTYAFNIKNGSSFNANENEAGIVARESLTVTVDRSEMHITNCTRRHGDEGRSGVNGANVVVVDHSTVEVSGCSDGYGLHANDLYVKDSTLTANNNGYSGIRITGKGEFTNSTVTVSGTKDKGNAAIELANVRNETNTGRLIGSLTVTGGSLTVSGNDATGIRCNSGTSLQTDDTSVVTIRNNTATPQNDWNALYDTAGGLLIRGNATATLGRSTVINNNSADKAGADIFIQPGGKLTFSAGNAGIGDILQDCGDGIDGWYIDAEGQRWDFHGDPSVAQKLLDSKDAALEYNGDGTYTITAGSEGLALKAAHAELPAPTPDPDGPDTPTPNPDPKPEPKPGPDTSITPEDPQLPPVQDARADDTPDSPVLPSSPTNPAVQDAHALPQTGTSLFAALAMALSGFALTIAGAWASLLGKNSRH